MRIHFLFIGEGPSDDGLIPHLENLCIEAGADEVTGVAIDFRRLLTPVDTNVAARLHTALQLEPEANLIFIHRDADSRHALPRHREIYEATIACSLNRPWIAVVPVQETEAWLLTDEMAIRTVAGHPTGRQPLNLPHPGDIENIANPKELLQEALVRASEFTGRRLQRFRRNFNAHRRLLLQRLPIGGPLLRLSAWVRLQNDVYKTIQQT